VFSAVWEERNLSKAARRLYVSQSAVSHALKRLRDDFGDPLFVRDSHGVSATNFAEALAPRVRELLASAEDLYRRPERFDPASARRTLSLATGDYFSVTMLESFAARLTAEAPKVRLVIRPVSSVFKLEKFESGEVDLAITAISVTLKEGFHSRELVQDRIAICAKKDHPGLRKRVTEEAYLALRHLNVSNFGSDRVVVDEYLEERKQRREVAAVASSFFDAACLLRGTDLVLSAPRRICEEIARFYGLAVHPFPFDLEPRSIAMIWHERNHRDPFHAWVRSLLRGG